MGGFKRLGKRIDYTSDELFENAVLDFFREDGSIYRTALEFEVIRDKVEKILVKNGIPLAESENAIKTKRLNDLVPNIIDYYLNLISVREIARKYELTFSSVRNRLKDVEEKFIITSKDKKSILRVIDNELTVHELSSLCGVAPLKIYNLFREYHEHKRCGNCNYVKNAILFPESDKFKFSATCKPCISKISQRPESKARHKEYVKNNKEILTKNRRKRDNKIKNDPILLAKKRAQRNENCKRKYKNDPNYKIKIVLRGYICNSLKAAGVKKDFKTIDILGCDVPFFMEYIKNMFLPGMTWENRGLYTWHLDHIRPMSSFDFTLERERKECFHYTNYQPLWATTEIAMKHGQPSTYQGNLNKWAN